MSLQINKTVSTTTFKDVPEEVVQRIALLTDLGDYLNVRCVCLQWSQFVQLHTYYVHNTPKYGCMSPQDCGWEAASIRPPLRLAIISQGGAITDSVDNAKPFVCYSPWKNKYFRVVGSNELNKVDEDHKVIGSYDLLRQKNSAIKYVFPFAKDKIATVFANGEVCFWYLLSMSSFCMKTLQLNIKEEGQSFEAHRVGDHFIVNNELVDLNNSSIMKIEMPPRIKTFGSCVCGTDKKGIQFFKFSGKTLEKKWTRNFADDIKDFTGVDLKDFNDQVICVDVFLKGGRYRRDILNTTDGGLVHSFETVEEYARGSYGIEERPLRLSGHVLCYKNDSGHILYFWHTRTKKPIQELDLKPFMPVAPAEFLWIEDFSLIGKKLTILFSKTVKQTFQTYYRVIQFDPL